MAATSSAIGNDSIELINIGAREGFNTARHLQNAVKQAKERRYDEFVIVDVDAHHYENMNLPDWFKYIEDPVLRHSALSERGSNILFGGGNNQSNAGRLLRYRDRDSEVGEEGVHLDITRARRQREAIGIDYQIVFPTMLLRMGNHPNPQIETALSWAYTRWWVEELLPQDDAVKTMVYLPFNDAKACLKIIDNFADHPGVLGGIVTSPRYSAVHENQFMPVYAALEERNMPIAFHGGWNPHERILEGMNKFLSVHAIGFVLYNLIHTTNLVVNGVPERFPNLKFIMIESGLAWVPFLMQRLDNEYGMRTNEAPMLQKRPSEYMSENFFYSTQPIETDNLRALEVTFEMIKADTQLMFASDYPHWDFNLPSTIFDLPFLKHDEKLNILGRNALNVFPKLASEIGSKV